MKKTLITLLFLPFLLFCGCAKECKLENYLSEYRSDIFMGKSENISLKANVIERENPFASDGIRANMTKIMEIIIECADNSFDYVISYKIGENQHGGEMNFSPTKQSYSITESVESVDVKEIDFHITFGDNSETIKATSVKEDDDLTKKQALDILKTNEHVTPFIQKDKFLGEIRLRLSHSNGKNYYYVALIDKQGKTTSLLLNSKTGEVLAIKK